MIRILEVRGETLIISNLIRLDTGKELDFIFDQLEPNDETLSTENTLTLNLYAPLSGEELANDGDWELEMFEKNQSIEREINPQLIDRLINLVEHNAV